MFGPYVHQLDPILFDINGVHFWWYGPGFALGFLELHLFLRRRHRPLHLSRSVTSKLAARQREFHTEA